MEKSKIERINFLAKKSRTATLTDEEKMEQSQLRKEYRDEFKANLLNTLEHTYTIDEKGNKKKIISKEELHGK